MPCKSRICERCGGDGDDDEMEMEGTYLVGGGIIWLATETKKGRKDWH